MVSEPMPFLSMYWTRREREWSSAKGPLRRRAGRARKERTKVQQRARARGYGDPSSRTREDHAGNVGSLLVGEFGEGSVRVVMRAFPERGG